MNYRDLITALLTVAAASAVSAQVLTADDDNYSGSLVFPFRRDAGQAFTRAEKELREGNLASGLSQLQVLLDQPHDSLIFRDGTYRSSWEAANGLIGELSEEGRTAYRRLADVQAQRILATARRRNDVGLLSRITDQYRHTEAGAEAAVQLALLAVDRGDVQVATDWLNFVRHSLRPASASPAIRVARQRVEEALAHRRDPDSSSLAAQDKMTVSPSAWRMDLGIGISTQRAIAESLGTLDAQGLNAIGNSRPLIVGKRVVARTFTGVLCLDVETGEPLWDHEIPSYVADVSRQSGSLDNPQLWGMASARILRRIVRDSLQDEMTSDGQSVYLIVVDESASNDLLAIDLASGRTRWRRELQLVPVRKESRRRQSDDDDPKTRFYLGPPLVDGDRLLILAQQIDRIELVALAPQTGQRLWAIPIGTASREFNQDLERRSLACRLSKVGNDVYCPTGAGGLVCIDTLQRRVRWAYRSARVDLPRHGNLKFDKTRISHMPKRDAWPTTTAWRQGDRVIWVSTETDAIQVLNAVTGSVLWAENRGDGLSVRSLGEDRLLMIGASSIVARDLVDGSLSWVTPTDRLTGRGAIHDGRLIVPTVSGQFQSIALDDGTLSRQEAEAYSSNPPFRISTHPPKGIEYIIPQNLVESSGLIISQSPTALECHSLSEAMDDISPSALFEEKPVLAGLLTMWADLQSTLAPLRETDIRCALVDAALATLLEATGLKQPESARLAALIAKLQEFSEQGPTDSFNSSRRKILEFELSRFSISSNQGAWRCRVDRWLQGWDIDRTLDARDRNESVSEDRVTANANPPESVTDDSAVVLQDKREWPPVLPTVTDRKANTRRSYLVRVPMTVAIDSPWNDVTVEVDRQARSVWFYDAEFPEPAVVSLPRETNSMRREWDYLHAWAPDDVLVLRIGTELIAFRRTADRQRPVETLWPSRGRTIALSGPRPPLQASIHTADAEALGEWNHASPGQVDLLERRVGEIGPVRADYLCYQQRGHLIALDAHTGHELWRRSRLPVGTRCLGDEERVVLFHPDADRVTVLRSLDGQAVHEWDLTKPDREETGSTPRWSHLRLVRGTDGLFVQSGGTDTVLHVLDLASGETKWHQRFPAQSQVFRGTDSFVGLFVPAITASPGGVQFLDWNTGETVASHGGPVPADVDKLVSFSDAWTQYVIISDRVTDRSLLQARQIRDGFRRPAVNGWLHAYDRQTGEFRWAQRLDNLAFPLDQPRHLPILIANDVVRTGRRSTVSGRLTGFDKTFGDPIVSISTTLHAYYSLETDRSRGEIALQLKGRSIQLKYDEGR